MSHDEVEVGAAMAKAVGDDEVMAQAAEGGEVKDVAGDDIAPHPAVRAASEKTLDELQTQPPDSNTQPADARAADAQPWEDKVAAALEVAREDDNSSDDDSLHDESPVEAVTDKVEEVKDALADKVSDVADATAEKLNDAGDKTPDAVIDAPVDEANEDEASKNAGPNGKRRNKNRRKRAAGS